MSRYRRNRRKQLRGGGNGPGFVEGGQKPGPSTHFEHNEPPSASEAVRQQQASATEDAEMQMAMNQTGGAQRGGSDEEELTVPQSGAASQEGNDAMAQSAGMLMQSRQNAPANTPAPDIKAGGFRRRRTRRKRGGEGEDCDVDEQCGKGEWCDDGNSEEGDGTCRIGVSPYGERVTGGRRKRRTRRRKKRKRKRTKKKRRRRKRKTKRKYKIARKYRQKGCSRKRR